jgi:Ca2+-binding EF-hand superfamily protein
MRGMGQPVPPESGLIEIPAGANPAGLVGQLVARYDRNKDGKLAKTEVAFDAKLFAELDANGDGLLDQSELAAFFKREPDLTFRLRTGQLGGAAGGAVRGFLKNVGLAKGGGAAGERATIVQPKAGPTVMTRLIKRVNGENLAFELGDCRFQLQATQGQTGRFNNGVKQFYNQQYDNLAEKKGYVAREQEKENRQQPFLFQIFTQADKNADGKLTKKELEDWLNLVAEGGTCHVSLQVNDQGRGLFNVFDANGDGQLSIREMRTVWERVKPVCKDAAKGLDQKDLPRKIQIVAGQGNVFFNAVPVAVFGGGMAPRARAAVGNVPVWFRKMDRNGDGDISPKEWLGTEEDFRQIDTDGDGLISAEEARKYEAAKGDPSKKTAKK